MRERTLFLAVWGTALLAGAIAVGTLGRYGVHIAAFGLLFAALATSWSWIRAAGLFSLGQAAFFGTGALTQGWLVTTGRLSPFVALGVSAVVGALVALPLVPALRLRPASFGLATLAYAVLLKGLAGNAPAFGMEGFLMPRMPGFERGVPLLVLALAFGLTLAYAMFLGRPSGRAANAIRQAPETASSLGIDVVGERWRPLIASAAATAIAGALYAHIVGSVETIVVFSPTFSVLPLVLGMLGGALHPLGGVLAALVLYPLDELVLRPALPHSHNLAYGFALVGLLLGRPEGFLRAPERRTAAPAPTRRASTWDPFPLSVRQLRVRRNGTEVLRDVSFVVQPGQILRVLGANGAGKTSLLLAIAGRLPAGDGSVFFGGSPAPRGAAARAQSGLARMFQAPQPFPEWSVRENVALAAERAGNLDAVDSLLEDLQLTALRDRPAGQLSVGEGKRLELARALAFRPAVLLLDEPLAGLSPEAAERVCGLIERARSNGAAIVWVEHGPAHDELASQLLVLEGGQVRFLGSPAAWNMVREKARP